MNNTLFETKDGRDRVTCGYVKRKGYERFGGKKVESLICEQMVKVENTIDPNYYSGVCSECGNKKYIKKGDV